MIEIEVEVSAGSNIEIPGMGGESMGDLLSGILPQKTKTQGERGGRKKDT
jgi:ATP-dependent HslUV protease ATP-binding subunit HslU